MIELIIEITAFLGVVSALFGKLHFGTRKTRRLFNEEFSQVKNEVHLLRRDLNSMRIDRVFRESLRNTIVGHVAMYVRVNKGSSRKVKNILTVWGKIINALASCWYNSEYRGVENHKEMAIFLMDWIKGELSIIKHFLNDEIKGVKVVHDRDKTGILFSEWIEKNNLYAQFEILVGALAKNGYHDEEAILKEFTEFIDKFFELFLDHILNWRALKTKIYEDYL